MSSKYPEKCHVRGCPCGYFSSKPPSESLETPEGDAGFLVPEAKNQSSGDSGPVIDPYEYLRTFKYAPSKAESVDDAERAEITVPTFEQEWHDAPRWATNYTDQQVAEYWFIRGQHAKEVELLAGMNLDLREMVRVARERIRQ